MKIKEIKGYELEKSKKNTSEDLFNQSEVTYEEDGVEKTLKVLYLRYFDEIKGELTPFKEDPVFEVGSKSINFKDIVALCFLVKNPELKNRKKVYMNSKEHFAAYFKDIDINEIQKMIPKG